MYLYTNNTAHKIMFIDADGVEIELGSGSTISRNKPLSSIPDGLVEVKLSLKK